MQLLVRPVRYAVLLLTVSSVWQSNGAGCDAIRACRKMKNQEQTSLAGFIRYRLIRSDLGNVGLIIMQQLETCEVPDFDYQWKNLPSKFIEYNEDRVTEFLNFTGLDKNSLQGKLCLDAGCGNGRYSYAMQRLGAARVDSFDISPEAVAKCKQINPDARVSDIMSLKPDPVYDFVLCWGVLNHVPAPRLAFSHVASQVKPQGGMLHIMVYHKDTQKPYDEGRKIWPNLSPEQRLKLCEEKASIYGGDIHGWYDAFNPSYNWSFHEKEPKKWFEEEGFRNIKLVTKRNINMNGRKRD